MGVSNPPSCSINTNYIYSPEVTSHFITVGGCTAIPKTMLKEFPPLWSSITRCCHVWGWMPTHPLASLGLSYPRTLCRHLCTPTLCVLTPVFQSISCLLDDWHTVVFSVHNMDVGQWTDRSTSIGMQCK